MTNDTSLPDAVPITEDTQVGHPDTSVLVTLPIQDGTQAVLHDAYDVQVYNEAQQSYSRLLETLSEAQAHLSTAPALTRDVFNSVYKRALALCDPDEMSAAYMHNREIVEQMMSTVEWKRLREAGTVADE